MAPSLDNEKGTFLIDNYGSGFALGFEGDESFIQRCQNFVINYGISSCRLNEIGVNLFYVTVTMDKLIQAAKDYFFANALIDKSSPTIMINGSNFKDCAKIRAQTDERANKFIAEKLVYDNFIARAKNFAAHEYKVKSA